MSIKISFNGNNVPELPIMVLAKKNGEKLGVLNTITNIVLSDSMSDTSEMSFTVHKEMDGVKCQLWDEIKDFRLVWCVEWNKWFSIEVKLTESSETVKDVTAYSLGEYELSQILLFDTEINTEDDINREDYVLPTVLYDSLHPERSLLHRVLEKAPHYRVAHVDTSIQNLQRTFSFNNTPIKSAFNEVAEEIGCLFTYDISIDENGQLDRTISVYDLQQTCLSCGYRGDFTGLCPKCGSDNIQNGYGTDTNVFVSTENLTKEISYTTNAGTVKNCFHLTAGDDLMTAVIRACNPAGGSYLWYLTDEVRNDMSDELRAAIAEYDAKNSLYTETQEYVLDSTKLAAYNALINKYSSYNLDLMPITSPIVGYAALMMAYYDVLDFGLYLQTSMMPDVPYQRKTAENQAALLTYASMSPVAVSKLSDSTSAATAESAIKTVVKAIIDTGRFSFKVNTESWNNPYWTGSVTVTSRTENESGETESATSARMTLTFTDDYETYLRQIIDKKMKAYDTDDVSVSTLISGTIEAVTNGVKQYSYDCLSSMANCCQDVLNVLVDDNAMSRLTNAQELIYTPYYNKLVVIQNEMDVRQSELTTIWGNSKTEEIGIQQLIEEIRSNVQSELNLKSQIGDELWTELSSFRRDGEYANNNYISDGLSNAELITNALEFIEKAKNEIYKSATLQHSISSTLYNLLVIEEFKPLLSSFEVGNWIRIRIDDKIYRLRLLNYEINFSNLTELQVAFSDVTKTLDGESDLESIISKASAISASYDYVQKQANLGADSRNILANWVSNGLETTQQKIVNSADDQDIVWDEHGMIFRRYDPITGEYRPQQLKIVNSTMAITDDNWQSIKTAVGRYYYLDPTTNQYVEAYGVNAETIVGKMILGQSLGIYNESGSLKFDYDGLSIANEKNSIVMNPNGSSLFSITKGNQNIFYLDSSGMLHISGDGAGLDISGNAGYTDLQLQIEKKIETWYQNTDPSSGSSWRNDGETASEANDRHTGDLWYDTRDNTTKRWNGAAWVEQSVSDAVFDTIDGKAQVFVSKPTTKYFANDLWILSDNDIANNLSAQYIAANGVKSGDILTCTTASTGTAFNENNWAKLTKYETKSGVEVLIDNKKSSIRLSADKLSWQSTNSSLTESGVLTATGATITGNITATNLTLSNGLTVGTVGSSSTGVSISSNGQLSASNASIRGAITATSLALTGSLTVGTYGTSSTGVEISSSGELKASNATLRGSIYATGGTIGGLTIANNSITANSGSFSISSTGDYYVFISDPYWGGYLFSVDKNGNVNAENLDCSELWTGNVHCSKVILGGGGKITGDDVNIENAYFTTDASLKGNLILVNSSWNTYQALSSSSGALYFGPNKDYSATTNLRGSTVRLYSHDSGAVYLGSSGSTAVTSDENLKDLYEINTKYEDFFMNLHPVLYKYKHNGHRTHIGYGARAVELALMSSGLSTEEFAGILIDRDVTISADEAQTEEDQHYDELYSLRYEEFGPLYAHMLQKAIRRIDELATEIESIKTKIQ